jgi:hypothetical protein
MDIIQSLQTLLKEDVLLQVHDDIQELQTQLNAKPNDKNIQEELEYMQQVKQYFDEVLLDIEHNNLSKEDAMDILQSLEQMRVEQML